MKAKGTVYKSVRLNNSINGNPRYKFLFLHEDDYLMELKTKTDGLVGYMFMPYCKYDCEIEFHITKAGNFICDAIHYTNN